MRLEQEQTMSNAIQGEQNAFNIRNSKKHLNNPDYAIYRSNHINPSELQPLQNILNPYAQFLDKLIPNATFESNADFKRYNLFSIDLKKDSTNNQSTNNHPHNNQLNEQEAKQQDSNIESRFKLENIYIIDKSNYNEALRAIKDYHNTSLTTENLLVIFIDTIESEIKIHKPNNTYLYLVSIKDNHIDCSFINNPLKECNLPNDKAELYLYKTQENNLPKITSLATQELTLKQEDNKELSAKENNLTYSFNGFNQLTIKQEEAILLTLSNYHFLLKQINTTNTDSNNTTNNTDKTNNNAISKDSNNTNKNDENAMLEDSYSNKDSSNPYTLKTHLQPNQSYSTLGIQLLSPQEQDTFSNNGNFSIHLKHINLICIENQTNNTITQDTPIFCYVQENKQTFITKLQDNELTLNINIDKNITKDSKGKIEPINTKNIFLSFIPFKDSTQANNTFSQKLQLTSTDLNKGNITKDFKIPYCKIQDCEEFGRWESEIYTTLYQLNKEKGRINSVKFLNNHINNELLKTIKQEEKESKTRILKSWTDTSQTITKDYTRIIALSTIDIINRKDMSRNPLIYKALDKLINDYQTYKDNFPQDYYVEFGRYMVKGGIQEQKGILAIKILSSLKECCSLIADSEIFDTEYNNGGVAIFHLYENYVPKFNGDENGLDKVKHFVYSALSCFVFGEKIADEMGIINERIDEFKLKKEEISVKLKQREKVDSTGFDRGDIEANRRGIKYGEELLERVWKGIVQWIKNPL